MVLRSHSWQTGARRRGRAPQGPAVPRAGCPETQGEWLHGAGWGRQSHLCRGAGGAAASLPVETSGDPLQTQVWGLRRNQAPFPADPRPGSGPVES